GLWSVDTGSGNAVTVFTPAVEGLQLRTRLAPALSMTTGTSVGGPMRADVVRVPELALGPWRFTHVVTDLSLATAGLFATSAWMGNLGAEIWRRFTVTVDIEGGALILQPNDALHES